MLNRYVIRGVNLDTFEAWDAHSVTRYEEAREKLEELRVLRGHWKTSPVVYGLVRRVIQ